MRLIQGIRVALDVIHQLGNLLFREQVEREVARQVSESKSNRESVSEPEPSLVVAM